MARRPAADADSDQDRLERLNAVFHAIRNVDQLIVRERDTDSLIRGVCELLVETRGYYSAWVALLDEDERVRATAQAGLGGAFDPILEGLSRRELPPCARATLAGPGVHVFREPASECHGCPLISAYRGRSAMTVRLSYGTRTYGIMGLSMSPEFSDDEEERGLVREVAGDIGFALHAIEHDELERRAAEELRHERDITASLFDTSPVAITVVDANGGIVRANAEAERVLGLGKTDISQRAYNDPAWRIVGFDGNPFPDEQLPVARVLREKRSVFGVEHVVQWPNGDRVLLSINASPVWSGQGAITHVVCTMRDVTAEKRTEASLRKSERSFRSLFESITSGFALFDTVFDAAGRPVDFRFLEVNPAFERIIGVKAGDVVGRTVLEVVPDAGRTWVEKFGQVVMSGVGAVLEGHAEDLQKDLRVVAYCPEPGRFATVFEDVSERKRAETALRESEERYRALFEQSLEAIWLIDWDGAVMDVNEAFLRLFGYERTDIASLTAQDLYEEPAERDRTLQRMVESGYVEGDVRLKRKDGTVLDCERHVVALRDQSGAIVALQGVARDVTGRKRAEAALRQSEEKYRALFEQSGEAISVVVTDGRLLDANRTWLALFGCTREELPNLNIGDFYAEPRGRDDFLKRIARVGWLKDEIRFRRRDGSVFLCDRSVVALKDASGAGIGFQATVRDITEARRAERALRESEERFRGVFEHGPMGIAIVDMTTNRFVRANLAYQQIVGYTEGELLQLHVSDVTVPEDWERQHEFVQARLDAGESGYTMEKRYIRKDGAIRDVYVVGESLRLAPDNPPLAIASVLDITDRKRVESELAESRENLRLLAQRVEQAREDERTTIARDLHDRVGQTLTALKLDIDRLMRMMEKAQPEALSLLSGMETMVTASVDDVRRISSELRPGALDDLGLEGAIEWQLDQMSPRTDIAFRFSRDAAGFDIDAARSTALFRVFQELVTNVVRHAGAKRADVSLQVEDGACILTVDDDGRGIDAAQVNDRHSLGIVGMRERLLPYGGELQIEGAPGKGTTARVIMPLR